MERQEENGRGWSKTFVNSSIMANFHVAAVGTTALRHLGNTPSSCGRREFLPGFFLTIWRRSLRVMPTTEAIYKQTTNLVAIL